MLPPRGDNGQLRGAFRQLCLQVRLRHYPQSSGQKHARLPERPRQPARVPASELPEDEGAFFLMRQRDASRSAASLPHQASRFHPLRHGPDTPGRPSLLRHPGRDRAPQTRDQQLHGARGHEVALRQQGLRAAEEETEERDHESADETRVPVSDVSVPHCVWSGHGHPEHREQPQGRLAPGHEEES